jgi:phosphohistidine swiveling domain-containing protein
MFAFKAIYKVGKKLNSGILPEIFYANIGPKLWWCWNKEKIDAIGYKLLEMVKDQKKVDSHFKLMDSIILTSNKSSNHLRQLYLSGELGKKTDHEIKQLFASHRNATEDGQGLMNSDGDAIELIPTQHLKNEIRRQLPQNLNGKDLNEKELEKKNLEEKEFIYIHNAITAPAHTSYIQFEEKQLLLIVKLILEKRLKLSDAAVLLMIKKVHDRYWWTSIGWESMTPKTTESFTAQLKELAKEYKTIKQIEDRIAAIDGNTSAILKKREELLKKYRISEETVDLIKLCDRYALYHDYRKEMQMKSIFGNYVLMWEIARRTGNKEEDLIWLDCEEVAGLLDKPLDKKEIERRKKAMTVVTLEAGIEVYSGEEAIHKKEEMLALNIDKVDEIRGEAASPGKVTARVKVCAGVKEALSKVKKGDVLVCGMTLPDYLPAMKLASAIVTDEGGITCHAAIVGRELGKPTIVGCKIATSALKDGDIVEVDGDVGVIRKVEK